MSRRPAALLALALASAALGQGAPSAGAETEADAIRNAPEAPPAAARPREGAAGALAAFVARCQAAETDQLAIRFQGKPLLEKVLVEPDEPIDSKSVTKSVVAMALGFLVDDGRIKSLDEPLHQWFPELAGDARKALTVRHLLTHTSGLEAKPLVNELTRAADLVKLALEAKLVSPPGSTVFYNNKAVALLGELVKKITGTRLDLYVGRKLFLELGFGKTVWIADGTGHPHCYDGLKLRAADLAKLGQLMLDRGAWRQKPLLSSAWVAELTRPSQALDPTLGLLWWIVPGDKPEAPRAFFARGHLGQYLVVVPAANLVVARLRRKRPATVDNEDFEMKDFPEAVLGLAAELTRGGI